MVNDVFPSFLISLFFFILSGFRYAKNCKTLSGINQRLTVLNTLQKQEKRAGNTFADFLLLYGNDTQLPLSLGLSILREKLFFAAMNEMRDYLWEKNGNVLCILRSKYFSFYFHFLLKLFTVIERFSENSPEHFLQVEKWKTKRYEINNYFAYACVFN